MKRLFISAATTATIAAASALLLACEKKSPNPPATPSASAKSGGKSAKSGANSTQDQIAEIDSLESLGVALPSFDELRDKAAQSINADNADAEFERLELEVEAEGG